MALTFEPEMLESRSRTRIIAYNPKNFEPLYRIDRIGNVIKGKAKHTPLLTSSSENPKSKPNFSFYSILQDLTSLYRV